MQHEFPLRLVEEITRCGSIRSAAEYLSITPSALNRRLLRLEEELDTPLFERTTNGVTLNPAGEVFIAHARKQLAEMKAVRSKIADLKGTRFGRVELAVDDNIVSIGSFAREVAAYQDTFQGVDFRVETGDETALVQSLTQYRADLALQLRPRANPLLTSLCSARALIHAVARPDHPALQADGPVRLHELAPYVWSLPQRGPLREEVAGAAQRLGLTHRIGLEIPPGLAASAMVHFSGVGFEVRTPHDPLPGGRLRSRPLSARDYKPFHVHLAQLKGRSLSVASGRFAEQIKKLFGDG